MAESQPFLVSALDHYAATKFVSITVVLLTLAFASLTARVLFKIRLKLLFTLDDYLILFGAAFALATWSLFITTIGPVAPSSKAFLDPPEYNNILKNGALACLTDTVSLASIKISVTCLLLKFQQSHIGKIFLYFLMAVIIISHVSYFLFTLLQCKPVAASWDYTIQGKCASHQVISNVSTTITSITIATDIILSLFPITILRQIRRPLMEKVLIGVLMAMGLAASATSVYKVFVVKEWVSANDMIGFAFQVAMLTCSELFLGITAACSPCLKPIVQRWLESIGVSFKPESPRSYVRRKHGNAIPGGVPSGPLQEFNTHTGGTTKTDVFDC